MKCPRCQAENLDERVYCWKCFAPLRSGAMGALPTVTAAPSPPHSATATRKPPVALLALVGVVVLAVIAVAAFLLLRPPQSPTGVTGTTGPTATPTTPTTPSPAPATPQPTVPPR